MDLCTLIGVAEEAAPLPKLPLFLSPVPAGWPSPAEDYVEHSLNLHAHLVSNPASTFFLRVSGDSMIGAGIFDGDLLVVDRALTACSGSIVIASVGGELTVKRYVVRGKRMFLVPENPDFSKIDVTELDDFLVWGVVIHSVHSFRPRHAMNKPLQPQIGHHRKVAS